MNISDYITFVSQIHYDSIATFHMRLSSAEFPSLQDASQFTGKGKMPAPVAVQKVTKRIHWTVQDLESFALFEKHFVKKSVLGKGGDGIVHSYTHLFGYKKIAVKTPYKITLKGGEALVEEIANLKAIGKHDNIVSMLAFCKDFPPMGPAIFFPVCDLGDLISYRDKWFKQEWAQKGASLRVPDVTVLKLMRDISLGLDFLHNQSGKCYVHQDIKPENILVVTPPGFVGTVPPEPIFKITDFARLSTYPMPADYIPKDDFRGTYEYAPPQHERIGPLKPAIDTWGLAATIQSFALNIEPTQSRAAVIRDRTSAGKPSPGIDDEEQWKTEHWRSRRPVIYRPLNITHAELVRNWDVEERDREFVQFHKPYSTMLNNWYKMMFDGQPEMRATSAYLKKYVVPLIDQQLLIEKELEWATQGFDKAVSLKESVAVRQVEQKGRGKWKRIMRDEGMVQFPSYEGNEY